MSINLSNQSCFDFLPTLEKNSIDLILIDPPYTISRSTGFESCGEKGVERFKMSYEFGEWDNEIFALDELLRKSLTAAALEADVDDADKGIFSTFP